MPVVSMLNLVQYLVLGGFACTQLVAISHLYPVIANIPLPGGPVNRYKVNCGFVPCRAVPFNVQYIVFLTSFSWSLYLLTCKS